MASRTAVTTQQRVNREEDVTSSSISRANGRPKTNGGTIPPAATTESSQTVDLKSPVTSASTLHRRFVLTDPVAFRYLEEDADVAVLERRGTLRGYELYIVEQWACSRVHPTFVITTYTGDPNHTVTVGVLGVPADESLWSDRLRVYFNAIGQYHARPRETSLGMLMVTNLSAFPSALTVIAIPDGDIRKHREDFLVNENLKRLGCSGRSGFNLSRPTAATQAKFHQLYKTSERNDLYPSVIELVKLCQVALMVFGKLGTEYCDGLLCDITESAISDWWTETGSEHYNIEPADGILGPTTVAGLLGLLMGARNRLNYMGAPVAKDAFDVQSLKRGIAYFQKSQKLERTRRLDRQTLGKLHRVTAKAAAGEGWAVHKAVKSTVVELSGKSGEMVMEMVGAKDKAGIGEIETLYIDKFVSLVYGERAKWLWYGKARRNNTDFGKPAQEAANMIFGTDDKGGYIWSGRKTDSFPAEDEPESRKREPGNDIYSSKPTGSTASVVESPAEPHLRERVLKSVTDKVTDARSGFGRFKDAVGFRGHASKHSKDIGPDGMAALSGYMSPSSSTLGPSTGTPLSPVGVGRAFTWKNKVEEYQDGYRKDRNSSVVAPASDKSRDSELPVNASKASLTGGTENIVSETVVDEPVGIGEKTWVEEVREIRDEVVMNEPAIAGSVADAGDLEGPVLTLERESENTGALLFRRHSLAEPKRQPRPRRNEAYWPRQMSFSHAEDAVLTWEDITTWNEEAADLDSWSTLKREKFLSENLQRLFRRAIDLKQDIGRWVKFKIDAVEEYNSQAMRDQDQFQTIYSKLNETYAAMHENSSYLLESERANLMEAIKELEGMDAKLEYEINALASKVEDVEDTVLEYSRQVTEVEERAIEVEKQLQIESWLHWAVRSVTGIGTRPPPAS